MDVLIAFLIFTIMMLISLITSMPVPAALITGLVAFAAVGWRRGYSFASLGKMCLRGMRKSLKVIIIMCIIGILTGVWRISGTIAAFVYYGIQAITPSMFLIIAFILSCILSYGIGTSFGAAGTLGAIFVTLAKSGGVNPTLTAGVIMSGIHFGDRTSPVSSVANMEAAITETALIDNVKMMIRTSILPLVICCITYTIASVRNPIQHINTEVMDAFRQEFNLSLWTFLPAVIILVLPVMKVDVIWSMIISIISGIAVVWFTQDVSWQETVSACIFGYEAHTECLKAIINGGGLASMLHVDIILLISCGYSGIFEETKMLDSIQKHLQNACKKCGRFPIMTCLGVCLSAVFCNQTITTLMCCDILKSSYPDGNGGRQELAIDLSNSVSLVGCMIPWNIACSVPLAFMGTDMSALPYAVYLYAVPVCYFFTKKRWYGNK